MLYDIAELDSTLLPDYWMEMASGSQLHLIDNTQRGIDEIRIDDIAIGLSKESRYAGHTRHQHVYTVAAHHLFVWSLGIRLLDPEEADHDLMLGLLLHDAHEYALKDLPFPLKQALKWVSFSDSNNLSPKNPTTGLPTPYKTLCDHLQDRIWDKFEVSLSDKAYMDIKSMDNISLFIESLFFMPSAGADWANTEHFFDVILPDYIAFFPGLSKKLYKKGFQGSVTSRGSAQEFTDIVDKFLDTLMFNPRKHRDLTPLGVAQYYLKALGRYGVESECGDIRELMTR